MRLLSPLELAHQLADRTSELRQFVRSEDDQNEDDDYEQFSPADTEHGIKPFRGILPP
jgi:hypothetical protein